MKKPFIYPFTVILFLFTTAVSFGQKHPKNIARQLDNKRITLFNGWPLTPVGKSLPVPLFKIGVVTDVQYCDCDNAGSRYYRLSPDKLKQANTRFKKENVDFIINLGDFIDRGFRVLNRHLG